MLIHHDNVTYEVKWESKNQDMIVWLVNEETGEECDLYEFPETIQDRAWDFSIEATLNENGLDDY